jgi:hypothetical protein
VTEVAILPNRQTALSATFEWCSGTIEQPGLSSLRKLVGFGEFEMSELRQNGIAAPGFEVNS